MTLTASSPLRALRGIGPRRERALAEAGLHRVSDLLFHLPHRYEDRRRVLSVAEALAAVAERGEPRRVVVTMLGRLTGLRRIRTRRRAALVRGRVEDGSASVEAVWFNRPYLPAQIRDDEEYLIHGELRSGPQGLQLVNASCEPPAGATSGGRIVPVYPGLGPLGPAAVRGLLDRLLAGFAPADQIEEPLPAALLAGHRLPELGSALATLHRPADGEDVDRLNARRSPAHGRLIYGELLELQLEVALLRSREQRREKEHRYHVDDRVRGIARALLPFKLTPAQKRVLREIVEDLRSPAPMLRLLQGDVGCGKTIVAALTLVLAMESGLQAAFMAPTELLAEQHFSTLRHLLAERYRMALVTASAVAASEAREALAAGDLQLAVGTHALLQEGVEFRSLGLVIIDEQHRFGVGQRHLLRRKGDRPDMLVMTATPIPRSLALTAYGDLELSVIDQLPPGRTPVRTEVVPEARRRQVYEQLRAELGGGAQGYVVFPLIEESDGLEVASVERMGAAVERFLTGFPCAILHGRTGREQRTGVMRDFAAGRIRLLLATSVIEVGVDVPAATVMVIESAQRFGLAQLHQLRGRVGRGSRPSRCIALHGRLSEEGRRRLEVFAASADGFRIAEADLEIRGPGDLLGTRQSGLPRFRVTDLVRDWDWLQRAREDARRLLSRLSAPELAPLRERVERQLAERYPMLDGG